MSDRESWIGVDLDGTLSLYDHWRGPNHVGEPIMPMLERVKKWVQEGKRVKIFTARAAPSGDPDYDKNVRLAIHSWLLHWDLPPLEITCQKDFGMVELWDDRAVALVTNTGMISQQLDRVEW